MNMFHLWGICFDEYVLLSTPNTFCGGWSSLFIQTFSKPLLCSALQGACFKNEVGFLNMYLYQNLKLDEK